MKLTARGVAVKASEDETSVLVFQRGFHRKEYHRASNDRQIFVETTPMSSSTTISCFRYSELLRQDLFPRNSSQRD